MNQYEKDIKLSDLVPTPLRIREVQSDSEHLANLVRSIVRHGFIRAMKILVRPLKDPATGKIISDKYEICNGMQRTDACRQAGIDVIPAVVDEDLTDDEVQQLQYGLNESVPTSLKDKVAHFKKYCAMHSNSTQKDISEEFCISQTELSKILRFKNLDPSIEGLIYSGKIKPTSAMQLVTIPTEYQAQFVEPAMSMKVSDFVDYVKDQRTAIAKARRLNTASVVVEHKPKLVDLLEGKKLHQNAKALLEAASLDNPEYKFLLGQFQMAEKFLQIDPDTIAYKIAEAAQTKEQRASEQADKRAAKRLEDAQKNMAELNRRKKETAQLAESLA